MDADVEYVYIVAAVQNGKDTVRLVRAVNNETIAKVMVHNLNRLLNSYQATFNDNPAFSAVYKKSIKQLDQAFPFGSNTELSYIVMSVLKDFIESTTLY
jgi:hypothetical protein